MAEEEEKSEEVEGIELVVKKSPISGSGIARIHMQILESSDLKEGKPVIIGSEKGKKRVLRLVADRMIEKDSISLRTKDMAKLGVNAGDKVLLYPYTTMGSRLTSRIFRSGK